MLHLVHARKDFKKLDSTSWAVINDRQALSREAIALTEHDGDEASIIFDSIDLEEYEAAWSVLQAVCMDATYVKKTAYNLFTLIRLGNVFAHREPVRPTSPLRALPC